MIKLKQPDRSGPDPTQRTLIDLAEERSLFKQADAINRGPIEGEEEDGEALVGRLGESFLWSFSLAMLHFTLDVLVTHQYAVDISWPSIISRAAQEFPSNSSLSSRRTLANQTNSVIFFCFYCLHPHSSPPIFLPRLSPSIQPAIHQIFFFAGSIFAGCYLIHISNTYGYFAVMKQAPPLGCLWIWSVIELDVQWAASSLIFCAVFLKYGGYSFL